MTAKLVRVPLLKVLDCQDPLMWYAGRVNEYVPYLARSSSEWKSREPSGYVNFIAAKNARIVHVLVTPDKLGQYPYNCAQPVSGRKPTSAACNAPKATKGGQSHAHTTAEVATNIVLGFGVSVAITAVLMPALGHNVTLSQNVAMTSVFTVASFVRAYGLRRFFNWLQLRGARGMP
jgi:hypothetical protein